MTSASPSYLQTLPNDQADTFLDALQKVKDHLSNELQSLNQQVQQKTMQLQGIEALLAETQAKESAQETTATSTPEATPSNLLTAPTLTEVLADNSQELPSNGAIASDAASPIEAVTAASAAATTRKQTKSAKQPAAAKAKQATKAGTSKGNTATKKKSTTQPKAKEKKTTTTKESELRALLRPAFQDKTFGDAVSEILEQANQPLHIDELIDKLYGELSHRDHERAKPSLANVLSVGSGKGRWRNVSKGMYAGNAMAAS